MWGWWAGQGPPALRPDTESLEASTLLSAEVDGGEEPRGLKHKLRKFAKNIWWWIY